jgi:hypothetical protein
MDLISVRRKCGVLNCTRPGILKKGIRYCYHHFKELCPDEYQNHLAERRKTERCNIEGCGKLIQRKRLCITHLKEKFSNIVKEKNRRYSTWFDKALKDPVYKEKYMTRYKRETNERSRRWKLAVLMHYSNGTMQCACDGCSSAFIEFLTIDHINGRGKRETLCQILTGRALYRWLMRNNYPEGYGYCVIIVMQVLGFMDTVPTQPRLTCRSKVVRCAYL